MILTAPQPSLPRCGCVLWVLRRRRSFARSPGPLRRPPSALCAPCSDCTVHANIVHRCTCIVRCLCHLGTMAGAEMNEKRTKQGADTQSTIVYTLQSHTVGSRSRFDSIGARMKLESRTKYPSRLQPGPATSHVAGSRPTLPSHEILPFPVARLALRVVPLQARVHAQASRHPRHRTGNLGVRRHPSQWHHLQEQHAGEPHT